MEGGCGGNSAHLALPARPKLMSEGGNRSGKDDFKFFVPLFAELRASPGLAINSFIYWYFLVNP